MQTFIKKSQQPEKIRPSTPLKLKLQKAEHSSMPDLDQKEQPIEKVDLNNKRNEISIDQRKKQN